MGYRQVVIRKSEKLNFKDNQLQVIKNDNVVKVPLEDINFIIIEDTTTVITTKLLSELGKNAISLIICDDKFLPTSIMYPYNYHFKQLDILEKQLSQSDEFRDLLWQMIVKKKIDNQLLVLIDETKNEQVISKLKQFRDEVTVGDMTNREGLAAKLYFRDLFGSKFIRSCDNGVNSALNYGYTILLSCIVRTLSVFGFNTYLGVHHKSKTNNFNLASDFIEVYRPIVDKFVYNHMEVITDDLSFDIRKELVNILNNEVMVNGKKVTVEYGIELLVKSYLKSLETGEVNLDFPNLLYDK